MPDFRQRFGLLVASDRLPIRAEAPTVRGDKKVAVLRLYDPIDSYGGSWGISSKEFAAALDELPDDIEEIRVLINSPGGEVFEGIAILNLLRSHKARIVAVVEGVAASSASFIACGADELVMARNSEIFIHDAWGLVVGNAADMRKLADDLDHFSDNIASVYADKAGGTVEEWRAAMAAETWYSAEEAVAAGLADTVDQSSDETAAEKAKNRFDLSIFKNDGRTSPAPVSASPPSPSPHRGQEGGSMSDLTNLREALGLPEDTSDDAVIVAAQERVLASVTPQPDPVATLPDGVTTIDAAQLEQLRNDAQAGRDARAQQLADQRTHLVNAAVNDGRIPPARRDHWVAQLEADPGAEQVLASLAKGTIPVAQIGGGGDADLDSEFAQDVKLFGETMARAMHGREGVAR